MPDFISTVLYEVNGNQYLDPHYLRTNTETQLNEYIGQIMKRKGATKFTITTQQITKIPAAILFVYGWDERTGKGLYFWHFNNGEAPSLSVQEAQEKFKALFPGFVGSIKCEYTAIVEYSTN